MAKRSGDVYENKRKNYHSRYCDIAGNSNGGAYILYAEYKYDAKDEGIFYADG